MDDFRTDGWMTEDGFEHIPVLYREVLEYLQGLGKSRRIIDGTLGCGGHSSLILKADGQAALLGIDRDDEALARASKALDFASDRIHLVRGQYSDLAEYATGLGWNSVDAILLDLGVSSPQIDDPRRGFSLKLDGPLDMRMDKRSPGTAGRLLNHKSEEELAKIFYEYGDIRKSRQLAQAIVARRKNEPWTGTRELAELCERVLGRIRPGGPPAATLCFQALRIAVNDELGELKKGLQAALTLLKTGGKIVIISFHSLEDRIVKNFFRDNAVECLCPPGYPVCMCGGHMAKLKILTKKPITAQADEIRRNPRAASAKLRAAEKI